MAHPIAQQFMGVEVFLRPPDPSDYPHMYHLECAGWAANRWRFSTQVPSFDAYVQLLWSNVFTQFLVVERNGSERPLGLVSAYNPDLANGFVWLAAVRYLEDAPASSYLEGVLIYLRHLFASTTFRKVYAEVAEDNEALFGRGLQRHFTLEGRFEEHLWRDGRYQDLLTYSLSRERWQEIEARLGRASAPR